MTHEEILNLWNKSQSETKLPGSTDAVLKFARRLTLGLEEEIGQQNKLARGNLITTLEAKYGGSWYCLVDEQPQKYPCMFADEQGVWIFHKNPIDDDHEFNGRQALYFRK